VRPPETAIRLITGQLRNGAPDELSRGSRVVWDVLCSRAGRAVPHAAAMAGAAGVGRLWWYMGRARRRALADARTLLGDSAGEHETRALARASLVEHAYRRALECRPWEMEAAAIDGLEHLDEAMAAGRGALLVTAHVGCMFAVGSALTARGRPSLTAAGPWADSDQSVGRLGRRARQYLEIRVRHGGRVTTVRGAAERLSAHLQAGGLCTVAFDAPGDAAVPFMGRLTRLPGGIARLAQRTGAPLVPVFAEYAPGHRPLVRLYPAIRPERFDNDVALTAHLAAVVEREIMARPHSLERSFIQQLFGGAGAPE